MGVSAALVVVRNAMAPRECQRVLDAVELFATTPEAGRQGTGYGKLSLLSQLEHPALVDAVRCVRAALGAPAAFDAWWLTYPVGSHIPEHVDPPPIDGLCHLRANLVVVRGRGGVLIADGEPVALDVGDLVVFRPDVVRHAVSLVEEPRAVLSLGTLWDTPTVQAVLTAARGC